MWRNLGLLHICDVEKSFKFFTCGEISDFYTSVMHKNLKFLHMTIFSLHISYVIYVTNMRFAPHNNSPNLKYFRFADKQMIKYLHFLIHFWIKCNYRLSQVLMWRTSSPFSEKIALHPMQSNSSSFSSSSDSSQSSSQISSAPTFSCLDIDSFKVSTLLSAATRATRAPIKVCC